MSNTLILADLVPASIVYFGCQEEQAHYLKKELTSSLVSWDEAEKSFLESVRLKKNAEKTEPPTILPSPAKAPRPSASTASSSSSSGTQAQQKGIPKWLKLGKK